MCSNFFFIVQGPIPACAGQPKNEDHAVAPRWAYPRVCGATYDTKAGQRCSLGLSPRVRGNLSKPEDFNLLFGPIPACAGQPRSGSRQKGHRRAYPRVCGATPALTSSPLSASGLSPRVRGNLLPRPPEKNCPGPIPACAGQPRMDAHCTGPGGAYPRVCGATGLRLSLQGCLRGLSPRVRGNPYSLMCMVAALGPIPACAGQPRMPMRGPRCRGAYPRVCGATERGRTGKRA